MDLVTDRETRLPLRKKDMVTVPLQPPPSLLNCPLSHRYLMYTDANH